jgi:hypothetical protein
MTERYTEGTTVIRMPRAIPLLMLLLLIVVHAPTQAQALMPPFLSGFFSSDLLSFTTNEPVTLLLTGVALLSLARIGIGKR